MYFKGGQPRPGLSTEPTSFAGGHTTHTTESSPDQIGLHRPVQSRMISGSKVRSGNSIYTPAAGNGPVQIQMIQGSKVSDENSIRTFAAAKGPVQSRMIHGSNVPGGNSIRPFTAANGPFHTAYDPFDFPPKLDQDRWTAPVSVCHACGNAIK